ncbi:hypothetical protein NDU88_008888 [Pleurodeles waltl]|uniref:Uncharacterized protein n=1 Tax=Pleurodeles waltl TaxID=8319 RepID=A0AAV7QQ36_PLEWA|nr:hypothetical protein NDU88_008888 [Pleurodeles waltl]
MCFSEPKVTVRVALGGKELDPGARPITALSESAPQADSALDLSTQKFVRAGARALTPARGIVGMLRVQVMRKALARASRGFSPKPHLNPGTLCDTCDVRVYGV